MASDDPVGNKRLTDARQRKSLTRQDLADAANKRLPPNYLLTASPRHLTEHHYIYQLWARRAFPMKGEAGIAAGSNSGSVASAVAHTTRVDVAARRRRRGPASSYRRTATAWNRWAGSS
jgi:hypothetical protein